MSASRAASSGAPNLPAGTSSASAGGGSVCGRPPCFFVQAGVHLGVDHPACNGIYLDIAGRKLLCERAGQTVYSRLGCGVCGFAGSACGSPHGGDVDDPSGFAGDHIRDRGAAAIEDGGKIRVRHCAPVFIRHVGEQPEPGGPRIVDQYVKPAAGIFYDFKDASHLIRITDVSRHGSTFSPGSEDLMFHFSELLQRFPAVDKYMPSGAGERQRARASDSSGRTGDENFLFIFHEHTPFRFLRTQQHFPRYKLPAERFRRSGLHSAKYFSKELYHVHRKECDIFQGFSL